MTDYKNYRFRELPISFLDVDAPEDCLWSTAKGEMRDFYMNFVISADGTKYMARDLAKENEHNRSEAVTEADLDEWDSFYEGHGITESFGIEEYWTKLESPEYKAEGA